MPSTPAMTTWVRCRMKVETPRNARPVSTCHHLLSTRTGTIDFMTSSGRMTPMDAMPTPDLAVP